MRKKYLETGKIVSPRGLNGEVRIEPWCNTPGFLRKFKNLYFGQHKKKLSVEHSFVHKSFVIMKFEEINSKEKSSKLKNQIVFVNKNDINLESGVYFFRDIIGCKILDVNTKKDYGIVSEIFKTGSNDVYKIVKKDRTYLIPAVSEIVCNVRIKEKLILIQPIKGIFDNEV
ncbi:MAG: ribosome maturation factor RimM [Oscillospiraceae bacterium]|nr:ribosome maturation factor RimM [Oscillospiraceae bacterium]